MDNYTHSQWTLNTTFKYGHFHNITTIQALESPNSGRKGGKYRSRCSKSASHMTCCSSQWSERLGTPNRPHYFNLQIMIPQWERVGLSKTGGPLVYHKKRKPQQMMSDKLLSHKMAPWQQKGSCATILLSCDPNQLGQQAS